MQLAELIKRRRSIRRYKKEQISQEELEAVMTAGAYAPNAGGGQRSIIIAIRSIELSEQLGKINAACMDRSRLAGSFVSEEQPSLIDDPGIRSGFYGAPTVCAIFAPANFLYSIPDAFCCAENMVLMATELGIASCIVARAEETFDNKFGEQLMKKWEIPDNYRARCFVLLGYHEGDYPKEKPVNKGRIRIIE